MIGFVVTVAMVLAIVFVGMWIFEDKDEGHDEWRGW